MTRFGRIIKAWARSTSPWPSTARRAFGVPNEEPSLDQDFALVVYNATNAAVPVIAPQSALISAESCTPTNGAADPGETVTMAVNLQNRGVVDATNLTATLLPGKGVMGP